MTDSALWRMSATELAAAIRSRQVSSREVVEAHLRRIEAVNGSVNAVVVVLAEQALDAAERADRAVGRGDDLPRLHGVPFTVKGNIDVAGTPTTQGMKALADAYPERDAPIVERVKAAGGIVLGRTNLPSAAVRWHCESELWGATLNPWDRSRTPGASSAGEAAAIATGMSPLGLGNDGLGSLRHPAQCCGVSALKPTLGRVPECQQCRARGRGHDRHSADRRQRSAGAAGRRPPAGLRDHRGADLARPVDRARAAVRPGAREADPSRPRARPGRAGNRGSGTGRCTQGGSGPRGRRISRRGGRAAGDRRCRQGPGRHAQHPRDPVGVAAGHAAVTP